jgi:hypothetical protein
MRKVTVAVFSVLLLAALANAQVPTSGNVFFGYSFYSTDLSSVDRANTNGWDAAFEGKVLPHLGLVADITGHYGSQNFNTSCTVPAGTGGGTCSLNADVSEHNVLFGPRVSVSVGKLRPFAEFMFGVGHVNANAAGSDTSFATSLGGGVDYKIIRPIAWRFEGDYVTTRFFGTTQNNVQLSTGIVLRF